LRIAARGAGLLSLLCIALLVGCGKSESTDSSNGAADTDSTHVASGTDKNDRDKNDKDKEDEKEEQPIVVDVVVLQQGSIESVIRAAANLEAERQVEVLAEASRRVVELLVEEGDVVRKGQSLLRLEEDEQRTALKRAETNHEKAKREVQRQKNLHERDLTSDQAYNDASDELKRTELLLEDAERAFSYTNVHAPIAGTITLRTVNIGNQVSVGQHLFSIIDFESMVAYVYIPEKNLKDLAVKQDVRVRARAVRDEIYAAKIERISPVVDPRSGTVKVTVGVGGQPGLRPGLFVDIAVVTATRDDALLLPKRALLYDNDQIFVYKLEEERRVSKRLVRPVLSDADFVMPLDGFAVGDSIVVAGQTGLKDQALVRLTTDPEPQDSEEDEADEDSRTSVASEGSHDD
jgi:membrane fusion protein (multidrug efflux system)